MPSKPQANSQAKSKTRPKTQPKSKRRKAEEEESKPMPKLRRILLDIFLIVSALAYVVAPNPFWFMILMVVNCIGGLYVGYRVFKASLNWLESLPGGVEEHVVLQRLAISLLCVVGLYELYLGSFSVLIYPYHGVVPPDEDFATVIVTASICNLGLLVIIALVGYVIGCIHIRYPKTSKLEIARLRQCAINAARWGYYLLQIGIHAIANTAKGFILMLATSAFAGLVCPRLPGYHGCSGGFIYFYTAIMGPGIIVALLMIPGAAGYGAMVNRREQLNEKTKGAVKLADRARRIRHLGAAAPAANLAGLSMSGDMITATYSYLVQEKVKVITPKTFRRLDTALMVFEILVSIAFLCTGFIS